MRSLRYLNVMLTVLAVLMTVQIWTTWTAGGSSMSMVHEAHAQGVPNAGAQRKEMIDALNKLNAQITTTNELLRSGQIRVQVESTTTSN